MRIKHLKLQIAITIPFDHPDENGVIYSRAAVEKAISSFTSKLPIIYRGNDTDQRESLLGFTNGETCSVLWNDEFQVCEVIVSGMTFFGGTECIVNQVKDNVITDFDIVALGFTE